jgi:hypothetical protein
MPFVRAGVSLGRDENMTIGVTKQSQIPLVTVINVRHLSGITRALTMSHQGDEA